MVSWIDVHRWVVTDIDGTLTASDAEAFQQSADASWEPRVAEVDLLPAVKQPFEW